MTDGSDPRPPSISRSRSLALADRCDRGQRREATLGIFVEAPRFVVEKMREPGQAVADGKDLVDLLLVLGDDDRGLGMVKDGGDFVGHRVGVNRNRNGADHLRRGDRPVEPRPVGADDGDRRAPLEPEPDQTLRDGASFVIDLSPGPGLPEAEILVAESRTRPAQGRVGAQEFREGVLRLWAFAPRRQAFPPWIAPVSLTRCRGKSA